MKQSSWRKKRSKEQTVVKDPATGKEVNKPSEIKRVSLEYVVNLLSKKTPDEKYAEKINSKKVVHFKRIE